jgi:hypothetical protein
MMLNYVYHKDGPSVDDEGRSRPSIPRLNTDIKLKSYIAVPLITTKTRELVDAE